MPFVIINSAGELSPVPTVAPEVPFPLYLTILNPAAGFALTILEILPSLFIEGKLRSWSNAFQFQET